MAPGPENVEVESRTDSERDENRTNQPPGEDFPGGPRSPHRELLHDAPASDDNGSARPNPTTPASESVPGNPAVIAATAQRTDGNGEPFPLSPPTLNEVPATPVVPTDDPAPATRSAPTPPAEEPRYAPEMLAFLDEDDDDSEEDVEGRAELERWNYLVESATHRRKGTLPNRAVASAPSRQATSSKSQRLSEQRSRRAQQRARDRAVEPSRLTPPPTGFGRVVASTDQWSRGRHGNLIEVTVLCNAATRKRVQQARTRTGVITLSEQMSTRCTAPADATGQLGRLPWDSGESAVEWRVDPASDELRARVPLLLLGTKGVRHKAGAVLGSFEFLSDECQTLTAASEEYFDHAADLIGAERAASTLAISAACEAVMEFDGWSDEERVQAESTYAAMMATDGNERPEAIPTGSAAPGDSAHPEHDDLDVDDDPAPVVAADIGKLLEHLREEPNGEAKYEHAYKKLSGFAPQFGRTSRDLRNQELKNLGEDLYTRVETGQQGPIACRQIRSNPKVRLAMEEIIAEMLDARVIIPSRSAWAAPALLVAKPHGGGWRFVTDFRKLNACVKTSHHPVPRLDDALDALAGKTRFSAFDMLSGYWQLPVRAGDTHKLAFATPSGQYEYIKTPMGLRNSSSCFMRLMSYALSGLLFKSCVCYVDDVIVASGDAKEDDDMVDFERHCDDLVDVLCRFETFGLMCKLKKTHLFTRRVQFLGHKVSKEGVEMDDEKIEAVRDWQFDQLTNKARVRSFLGLAGFYRRFQPGFADRSRALREATLDHIDFDEVMRRPETEAAFVDLRAQLIRPDRVLLQHPDLTKRFDIRTDASEYGIGAILEQDGRPVAYLSRPLSRAEAKWTTAERECLSVIYALEHWSSYIVGSDYMVFNDHSNLRWVLSTPPERGRLARWAIRLSTFDDIENRITHVPGKYMDGPDGLSRKYSNATNYVGREYPNFPASAGSDKHRRTGAREPVTTPSRGAIEATLAAQAEAARDVGGGAEHVPPHGPSEDAADADAPAPTITASEGPFRHHANALGPVQVQHVQPERQLTGLSIFSGVGSDALAAPDVNWIFIEHDPYARDILNACGRIVFSSVEKFLALVRDGYFAVGHIDIMVACPSCRGHSGARHLQNTPLDVSGLPPPADINDFVGVNDIIGELVILNLRPRTVVIEMTAAPTGPHGHFMAPSARAEKQARFDMVVDRLRLFYNQVRYGNQDSAALGAPITKTHWYAIAADDSSGIQLTKRPSHRGARRTLGSYFLPPSDHRVQERVVRSHWPDVPSEGGPPPHNTGDTPSDFGLPAEADGYVLRPVQDAAGMKGVLASFERAGDSAERGFVAQWADGTRSHLTWSDAKVHNARAPQREPYSNAQVATFLRTAARGGSLVRRPPPELSADLTEADHNELTRSKTLFMVTRSTAGYLSRAGDHVYCDKHQIKSRRSIAHPMSAAYAESRITDPMVYDSRIGEARTLAVIEWARLKGLPETVCQHLDTMAALNAHGEYVAFKLIANCIEIQAWTCVLGNVVAAIVTADAVALEHTRRQIAADESAAQAEADAHRTVRADCPMTRANWITAQDEDSECNAISHAVRMRDANGGEDADLKRGEVDSRGYVIVDNILRYSAIVANYGIGIEDLIRPQELRMTEITDRSCNLRVVVPSIWRVRLIDATHRANLHIRHQRLNEVLTREYFWPRMRQVIEDRAKVCRECQFARRYRSSNAGRPVATTAVGRFMEYICVDWVSVDPSNAAETGFSGFMSVLDMATGYAWAEPATNHHMETTARVLLRIFKCHGVPFKILSDNGAEFVNSCWESLFALLGGVRRLTTTPYHPEGNGKIEVWHRWVMERVRSAVIECEKPSAWPDALAAAVQVHNHSRTSTAPHSPYEQAFGRKARNAMMAWEESEALNVPEALRGPGTIYEEMRIASEFMRDGQQIATNVARKQAAVSAAQYEVAYRVGELVLELQEARALQSAADYQPPKLATPAKPRVCIITDTLGNGNVRIRAVTRRSDPPREISISKLRRYVSFSNGQLAAEDPDNIVEARLGDFVLVEVEPPSEGRVNNGERHRPFPAQVLKIRGPKLTLQLYRSGGDPNTFDPPLLPVWMKKASKGNRTPRNIVTSAEKQPSWAPYSFDATYNNIVSQPFSRFTTSGRIPLLAMQEAQNQMQHTALPDWSALLAESEDDASVMRRW